MRAFVLAFFIPSARPPPFAELYLERVLGADRSLSWTFSVVETPAIVGAPDFGMHLNLVGIRTRRRDKLTQAPVAIEGALTWE